VATIHMGQKEGVLCPFRVGNLGRRLTQCGLGRGLYFRIKWRLHLSSRLATIDMGQKLGGGNFPVLNCPHQWVLGWHCNFTVYRALVGYVGYSVTFQNKSCATSSEITFVHVICNFIGGIVFSASISFAISDQFYSCGNPVYAFERMLYDNNQVQRH